MSSPAQPEPSMEEILASIRRIISEDPATAPAAAPAEPPTTLTYTPEPVEAGGTLNVPQEPEPVTMPLDEVFELTPDMRTEPYTPPAPEPVSEPEPVPLTYTPEPKPMAYTHEQEPSETLMSAHTEAAASAALAGFTTSITSRTGFAGHTVEDVVRELLRPMLRDWMDANLPTLVERLVEAEIERLARRRT